MLNFQNLFMSKKLLRSLAFMLLLLPLTVFAAPHIFYTDIVTGPNTGGENNNGAYLTVFGSGFGATQNGSQVTINNVPVAVYKQWSDTKITVQPGASVMSGAIKVTVSGQPSNTDNSFSVVPGKIFFVALDGRDNSGKAGDITRPFRSIQSTLDRSDFGPGDHIVVRGGNWTDVFGMYSSFFSIHHKSGKADAPLVVMGYPTETVTLLRTATNGVARGIHNYASEGHFVIANFHVNLNKGGSVCIGLAPRDVRIVNNEGWGMFEDSGGGACIAGSGKKYRILGNHVHDNGGSKLYHGIYVDARDTTNGGPNDIEIAYNHVHHQVGGRGIQIYGDTGTIINNVRIHHNLIHDIHLDGIIISRDTGTGFQVYNNVVYHTGDNSLQGPTADSGSTGGCIRFAGTQTVVEVYNNTFVDCAVDRNKDSAALRLENFSQLTLRNNILESPGVVNWGGSALSSAITASNNLWVGAGTPPTYLGAAIGDPFFVSSPVRNYHLSTGSAAIDKGSSAVNTVVTTDFDGNVRPQGSGYDIGAFEFVQPTPAQRQDTAPKK
jgi:hypothetical protein